MFFSGAKACICGEGMKGWYGKLGFLVSIGPVMFMILGSSRCRPKSPKQENGRQDIVDNVKDITIKKFLVCNAELKEMSNLNVKGITVSWRKRTKGNCE